MKTSKIITIIIVLAFVGFFAFMGLRKNTGVVNTTPIEQQASAIKGCYVATLAQDVYTLSITSQDGENISGMLRFKNFEKDSSSGTFEGTYKDGILLGDYSFDSEGMHSVRQVIFKKTPEGFVEGFGDLDASGERFANLNTISYDNSPVFKAVADCTNTTSLNTSDWKTFSDPVHKITFKYPAQLPATYITAVDWPPKLNVEDKVLTCTQAGKETASAGKTSKKTIHGKEYCVTVETEGAAGSIYTQYAYATQISNKTFFFTFSTREVQCGNYDDPKKTACEIERASFNIDSLLDQIVDTLK